MKIRLFFCFSLTASLALSQNVSRSVFEIPETELEAAHQANPDDVMITGRLIRYYASENRDASWSARFALLSTNIEHHPDGAFFNSRDVYANMPQTLREQLKTMWVVQVRQHPDNPAILRNAAAGLEVFPPLPTSIRVGGNVQQANLIRQVKPAYPKLARDAGVQGTVKMNVTIAQDGSISMLQLESGHPLLVQSAMEAAKQWKYKPTLLNGNPVAVITTIEIAFALNDTPSPELNPGNGVIVR